MSTTANAPSYAMAGERYTAFTGALLAVLDSPHPLSLDEIYHSIGTDLRSRGLPPPQQRATDTAADLALVRGPAEPDETSPQPVGQVRFYRDKAATRRTLTAGTSKALKRFSLFTGAAAVLAATLANDPDLLWGIPVLGIACLVWIVLIALFVLWASPQEAELVIDHSGITVHARTGRQSPTHRAFRGKTFPTWASCPPNAAPSTRGPSESTKAITFSLSAYTQASPTARRKACSFRNRSMNSATGS
ncbi:hypothetical protein [Streptomyces sp. NPDC002221]|uniref:hypothetical protein n=1 Tax=Streptomyces sp. NPDC002221 TaxID=3364639 RepID=UPI0036BB3F33